MKSAVPEERSRFKELDNTVRKAAKGVVDASIALAEIKQQKLFTIAGYDTFVEYCEAVHQMSKTYAYSLIAAGKTYLRLSAIAENQGLDVDQLPRVESQLRELSRVKDPEQQCAILAEVIEEKGPDYTAADISEKVDRIRASGGKKRKDTPKQRLEKVWESFERLRDIVGAVSYGRHEKEVVDLLKSLEKLLGE